MARASLCLLLAATLLQVSWQTLEDDINDEINNSNGTEKSLSRKRRYLVFPTGSSLQLVYCLTVPSVGMGQIFTLGHTAALAWELPDKPEFILDLKNKKFGHTTTEAPETTTLPPLHHDHDEDYHHDYDQYGAPPPLERFDKPTKYYSGRWSPLRNKQPGAVSNRKTYYNPFFINKPASSVFGYSPIRGVSNQAGNRVSTNSITGSASRGKLKGSRPKTVRLSTSSNRYSNRWKSEKTPITTYIHPVYHQHYRRTRRDLYGKIENLFTALSKDGKSCLLKAICEVSQVAQRKGSFMEEIIKAVFRVKPHDKYPDEDDYDTAANRSHNCTEKYPTCDGSIWSKLDSNISLSRCSSSVICRIPYKVREEI